MRTYDWTRIQGHTRLELTVCSAAGYSSVPVRLEPRSEGTLSSGSVRVCPLTIGVRAERGVVTGRERTDSLAMSCPSPRPTLLLRGIEAGECPLVWILVRGARCFGSWLRPGDRRRSGRNYRRKQNDCCQQYLVHQLLPLSEPLEVDCSIPSRFCINNSQLTSREIHVKDTDHHLVNDGAGSPPLQERSASVFR